MGLDVIYMVLKVVKGEEPELEIQLRVSTSSEHLILKLPCHNLKKSITFMCHMTKRLQQERERLTMNKFPGA